MADKCVVCEMPVDPKTAVYTTEYEDRVYYFCGDGCAQRFHRDPDTYTGEEEEDDADTAPA